MRRRRSVFGEDSKFGMAVKEGISVDLRKD
jgi:hypothetical protein